MQQNGGKILTATITISRNLPILHRIKRTGLSGTKSQIKILIFCRMHFCFVVSGLGNLGHYGAPSQQQNEPYCMLFQKSATPLAIATADGTGRLLDW